MTKTKVKITGRTKSVKTPTQIAERILHDRGFQYGMGAVGTIGDRNLEEALKDSMKNVGRVNKSFAFVIYVSPDGKGGEEYRINTYISKNPLNPSYGHS